MPIKNIFLPFVLFFTLVSFVSGEDILFRVIKDSPAWYDEWPIKKTKDNIKLKIAKDEVVKVIGSPYIDTVDGKVCIVIKIVFNNEKYIAQIDNFVSSTTNDLFDDSLTTSDDENWIRAGYLRVLSSKNRDTFYEFEYDSIDTWNDAKSGVLELRDTEWYEMSDYNNLSMEIYQSLITFGGFVARDVLITNIKKITNGYNVAVIDPEFGEYRYEGKIFGLFAGWAPIETPSFDFTLIQDGDYLDIHFNTTEKRTATFVRVNKEIVDMLQTLIKSNTCDLSKITYWPRRADGSMDYQPPSAISNDSTDQSAGEIDSANNDENQIVGNNVKANSLPLWAWIVIIGGVVAAFGGVIVFVVLRKKH